MKSSEPPNCSRIKRESFFIVLDLFLNKPPTLIASSISSTLASAKSFGVIGNFFERFLKALSVFPLAVACESTVIISVWNGSLDALTHRGREKLFRSIWRIWVDKTEIKCRWIELKLNIDKIYNYLIIFLYIIYFFIGSFCIYFTSLYIDYLSVGELLLIVFMIGLFCFIVSINLANKFRSPKAINKIEWIWYLFDLY